jgi:hypothetical protein
MTIATKVGKLEKGFIMEGKPDSCLHLGQIIIINLHVFIKI